MTTIKHYSLEFNHFMIVQEYTMLASIETNASTITEQCSLDLIMTNKIIIILGTGVRSGPLKPEKKLDLV
jgi:hypothetical protein